MRATAPEAKRHQKHWDDIVRDPALRDLPYKVETNAQGQLVLNPHTAYHSRQQKALQTLLDRLLPEGEAFPEYPIATSEGVKQADVIWASRKRQQEMEETGDPPTQAPEICVEVMSDTNTDEERREKRRLYRDAGAEEVWIVDSEGHVRFFAEDELDQSSLAPGFPEQVEQVSEWTPSVCG
jgi:Uma2 family endonuclease